jgi:hypothetical protein
MRNVRITDEQATSLKQQIEKMESQDWPEDGLLAVAGEGDSFTVRAADIAALLFRPLASPGRFETFKRWWIDLEYGNRINGIASNEDWEAFDRAAFGSRKDGQMLRLKAGAHELFVCAASLLSWRGLSDSYGPSLDFEDDHGDHGQKYRGDGGGFRGGGFRGRDGGRPQPRFAGSGGRRFNGGGFGGDDRGGGFNRGDRGDRGYERGGDWQGQ